MSSATFGLHVGNTSACLAVFKDGKCDVVANPAGDRVTPAAVGYQDGSKEGRLVGQTAKQHSLRFPKSVRKNGHTAFLSKTMNDVEEMMNSPAAKYVDRSTVSATNPEDPSTPVVYQLTLENGHNFRSTPHEALMHVMKYMHDIALTHGGAGDDDEDEDLKVVLSVPLSYPEKSVETFKKCAEKAGFSVMQVISAPAASALAYNLGQLDVSEESFNALVFRVGGLSTTASLIRVQAGFISVLDSEHSWIGGDLLTSMLSDFLAAEFQRKHRADPRETKRGKAKLTANAENLKHILSTLNTANCYIESLYEGIDFNANVTRARFENEIGKVISQYMAPIQTLLERSGISQDEIGKVIFCGGSAKVPKIQTAVKDIFKSAEFLSSINPDEVLAYGAALESSLVEGRRSTCDALQAEVKAIRFQLGFISSSKNEKDSFQVLIPANTPIPVRKSSILEVKDQKIEVVVQVRNTNGVDGIVTLGTMKLEDLSSEEGHKVSVSTHISRDGGIHATLIDKVSGKSAQLTLNPPSSA